MDERTDRRTYVQIPPVFYRTSSPFGPPFGAVAQKEEEEEPVAQRQDVVSGTLALL